MTAKDSNHARGFPMRQLVGQDAAFLHVETATVKTHFTLLTIYDQSTAPGGRLRYRDILEYFEQRR